jgi:uncharacterized protein (TIGR00369 family)
MTCAIVNRMTVSIPDGFTPFTRSSPFLELIGPFYSRIEECGLVFGLRIEDRHCNRRQTAHGGLLTTFADIVLGYSSDHGGDVALTTATVGLSFLGSARIGDWVEGHADVLKVGQRAAFATCVLSVDGARILHASGSFSVAHTAGAAS